MSVSFARPDVADLQFYLYARALHPELFRPQTTQRVCKPGFLVEVQICDDGHVLKFHRGEDDLTEILTADGALFPRHKRLLDRRIHGCRNADCELPEGIRYQASVQLERLNSELYHHAHEELLIDSRSASLAFAFPASHRFSCNPLSVIRLEVELDSVLVHAFHTFPESSAVVKSQSLIEF